MGDSDVKSTWNKYWGEQILGGTNTRGNKYWGE